jgi:hypothetical protein
VRIKNKVLGLLAALCALPTGVLHAQAFGAVNAVEFTTSFPFYVSGQKMPAGSYVMTQPSIDSDIVQIRDTAFLHSAFVLFTPAVSAQPIAHGEVTFRQYGDIDYLSDITLTGEETGLTVPESPAEKRTTRRNHIIASLRTVALQSNVRG